MRAGSGQQAAGISKSRLKRKSIFCFSISVLLIAVCFSVEAQQQRKIPRVGFLSGAGDPSNPGPAVEAFRQGLRDRGYSERRNILVEYRYAEGKRERISELVTQLVQLKVDVLVLITLPSVRVAKEATRTIPIVMVLAVDPIENGVVASLARPNGNITGLATLQRELSSKRLELLKEVIPSMSRVAVLRDADAPGSAIGFKEYEAAARGLKVQLQSLEVHGPKPDLEAAFETAVRERAKAFITVRNPLLRRFTNRIAALAIKHRLPSLHEGSESVEVGGLMSYGVNDADQWRRAAIYVDKILKGAKPADLPIEQPKKFELVANLKTAKQIGLIIPPNVLARADKVIR